MFKTYDLFRNSNMNDSVAKTMYYYLFEGLSLTEIEEKLFSTRSYKGWWSKSILNFYGIDTQRGANSGMYKGRSIEEVAKILHSSENLYHLQVANILSEYYL